jgi:hypothetical protein
MDVFDLRRVAVLLAVYERYTLAGTKGQDALTPDDWDMIAALDMLAAENGNG